MKCARIAVIAMAAALPRAMHAQHTDTIVARTPGNVAEADVRRLTLDWQASVDRSEIGDIGGLALGPDGRIYIWDPATPSIWMMSTDGKTVARIGRRGAGPGEYGRLNGIAVMKNGNLVAWDEGNTRVNFYDPNGKFLSSAIVPYPFCCPSNVVTADTLDRVWLYFIDGVVPRGGEKGDPLSTTRTRRSAFLVLDHTGAVRDTIEAPQLRQEFAPLSAVGPNSVSARVMPYGGVPRHVASPLGRVIAGTGRPYVVYSAGGARPLRIESSMTAVPISREERGQWRASLEAALKRVQPDWKWTGPDIPSEKPAYADLRVGMDGRIWVGLSVPSEAFTPEPAAASDGPPLPQITFRVTEKRWDVFSSEGAFIARVVGPRRFTPYVMSGSTMWGVLRDADDVPTVVRMKF
ncbi:MAG TPA: 6-bladed beta-propeller [Gemmatimonadaceae bacterium]|nr:6-bladed beta-propeller [Gemmatimonadaceae bacterium]